MRTTRHHWRIRTVAATAAVLLSTTVLTACGSGGPGDAGGDDGSFDVWVYQDASTKVQKDVVDRFNKQSDVKAKLVSVAGEGYQDKMRTAMGSPNAPDVFFNWGGGSISDFVDKDMLVDLTPFLEKDPEFKEAFIPSLLDAGKIGDKYYGVPMRGVQPVLLFHNKKVFKDAGATPPSSWEDVLKLVDTFKEKDITPFVLAGADAWTELMWLEYLLERHGGPEVFQKIQNGDSAAWGDPAVLKAATTVKELVDRGAFGDNYKSVNYTADGASTLFAKGQAAMHLMGSWEYSNQLTNQPDFAADDLGWAAFPAIPGGSGDPKNVVGNPTNYWSVNTRTKEKDAAVEFVKFAAEQEYSKALVTNGEVPPTSDAAEMLTEHSNPEYAKFQYDMVSQAPAFTLSWDQALSAKQSAPMLINIQKLFNGQLSPQAFIDAQKAL